jgi:23S rRNA-/tRNA-specific pseudouridylate synthase
MWCYPNTIAGVSRTQLSRHIGEGAVTLNGKAASPSQKVRAGDTVVWTPPRVRAVELLAQDIPLRVVFEDEHLVVVDKPPGLVVHPAAGHDDGTLVNALWPTATTCAASAASCDQASSTASTRIRRGCWWWPRTT